MNQDQDNQPATDGKRKLPGDAPPSMEQATGGRKEKPVQDAASAADNANPPRGPETNPRGIGATEREAPTSQGTGGPHVDPARQRDTGPLQNDERRDQRGVE